MQGLAFTLLTCLLAGSPLPGQANDQALLMRIEQLGLNGGIGPLDYRSEILYYRDGLITLRTEDAGCLLTLGRSKASRDALTELSLAFATHRVGFASGSCALDFSNPGGFLITRYHWLGKNGRRSYFEVTSIDIPGPPCDPRHAALARAAAAYFNQAGTGGPSELVVIELPEPAPCDLGVP